MQVGQIFFSYSRADAVFALRLASDLKKEGIDVWIDQIDIRPSEPWDEEIEKALTESACLIVVLSKTSVASDNVLNEINYALESKKQVLPILIDDDLRKPLNIIRLQHIDFRTSYNTGLSVLLRSLQSDRQIQNATPISSSKLVRLTLALIAFAIATVLVIVYAGKGGNEHVQALPEKPNIQMPGSAQVVSGSINGTWTTDEVTNPFDENDKYLVNFTFEVFDTTLVGTISFVSTVGYKGYTIKKGFMGGSVNADNISFYTVETFLGETNSTYKNYYSGRIADSVIAFTLQSDRAGGFPGQRFTARKNPVQKRS